MIKYIVFDSGSSASKLMFHDVNQLHNAIETSHIYNISNPVFKFFHKIHMSGRINKWINLPGKSIWDKYCVIEEATKHPENEYIVVFTNISVRKIRLGYLQRISKMNNVFLVLVAVDSFLDQKLCPLDIMQAVKFSLVYSFDKADCEKYGLEYTRSLYSMRKDISPAKETCTLFFVGRAKDRLQSLQQVVELANMHGCKCKFYILGVAKKQRKPIQGIEYIDTVLSYDEVLPVIHSADALFDFVQEGQVGLTMRVYEAIFYNKKLITNNLSVKDLEYYNPQYMQVIDNILDISFEFLQKNNSVDYGYCGEYSPIRFLEDVKNKLSKEGLLK